jgi:glycosyltransferase involved in cell wall biosynthesis
MRICLVTHALTPHEVTGVENHTAQLARGLARAGAEVQVFAPGPAEGVWRLSQRLEKRDGYEVHWLALGERQPDDDGDEPGVAEAFGRYLDRERPDIVHAQHLIGLGPKLVFEARRRGMPFLFTAHDAWLVSEEYRLLRPDLSALEPGDSASMARVLLARKLLDRLMPDADHQGLALKDDLNEEGRALLAEVLDGDPRAAGFEPTEIEAMQQRADAGLRARLAAVRGMDVIISPTRFLAGVLESGGVTAPLEVEPCGIDFKKSARKRRLKSSPLRVAFLGGVSKHKGLDDLLEAVAGLEGLELCVHGGSSDRTFSLRCEARARELGVEWCGPFVNEELPGILARTDLVVVPSKWPENAPFVIREAFAAGVPVVAADVGAMAESVRDGVDAWLYPAGDVEALRERLSALVESRSTLREAAASVLPPRSIDEQATSLLDRYRALLPSAQDLQRGQLEHLSAFTQRFEEVHDMRWDELVEGALEGYANLCKSLGGQRSSTERVMRALSKGSKLRERLAEGVRAQAWLKSAAADARKQRDEVEAHSSWQEGDRSALLENTRHLEEQLKTRLDEVDAISLQGAKDDEALEEALLEARRRSVELESSEKELRWLREQLEFARKETERGLRERDERDRDLMARTEESEWLKRDLEERDQRLAELSKSEESLEVVKEESGWLRAQLKFLQDETKRARRALDERERDLTERTAESEWLKSELLERDEQLKSDEVSEDALGAVTAETRWLRDQLEFARAETERMRRALDERELDLAERTKEAVWLKSEVSVRDGLLEARSRMDSEIELASAEVRWLQGLLESSELKVERIEVLSDHKDKTLDERLRETEWLKGELADRDLRLAHSARKLEDERRSTSAAKAEGEHQRALGECAKEEASWLDGVMNSKEEELAERQRELSSSEETCAHLAKEVAWLRETHGALREEISFLGSELSVREAERGRWRAEMERLSNQQRRLLEHELWLRGELRRLLDAVSGAATEELSTEDIAARVSDAVDMLVVSDEPEERP